MKRKWFIITVSICLLVGAPVGWYFTFVYPRLAREARILRIKKANWQSLQQRLNRQNLKFTGRAGIIVKDLDTGWEFAYGQDQPFASASMVKIPIMAAVFKAGQEGLIDLSGTVRLDGQDKVLGSGKLKGMPNGSVYSIRELVKLMVTSSDNTAANMLIDILGMDYLNNSFKEFGLKQTNLSRKMMDFRVRRNGTENYTTAADTALLLEKIYRKTLVNAAVSSQCLEILKAQKIRDRIPAKLPAATLVAHKTGLERGICHDAGIVYCPQGDLLICVLTKGTKSSRSAKAFIARLSLEAYNSYSSNNPILER